MEAPTQRRHARGLVRQALIAIACVPLAFPDAAAAEVCDKVVGEHWRPGNGPAWTVTFPRSDWANVSLATWAIVFGIPCVLTLATLRSRIPLLLAIVLKWVGYVLAALIILVAFFAMHATIVPEGLDAIHVLAAKEGCVVFRTNWRAVAVNTAVVGLIVLPHLWMAFRMKHYERLVEARHRHPVGP
jgi:hypothetical protein